MTSSAIRLAAAVLLLPLLLSACKESTPAAAPAPTAPSTASPTPTPTKSLLDIKFPNTHEELRAALPTAYGKVPLALDSGVVGGGWSPRDDPFEGRKVNPESCRALLWTGGRTVTTFAEFPYLPHADAYSADERVGITAELVSLPTPFGDKYMDLYPQAAPQCTRMRIDGTEPASIVERSVPGLGSHSRYVLRTYLSGGKIHREGIITFTTPTYFAQVSSYWPTFNESALLAFARQLQSRADQKLRH